MKKIKNTPLDIDEDEDDDELFEELGKYERVEIENSDGIKAWKCVKKRYYNRSFP